ncbi:MAG: coenzyme F420-0:L-glutamate ligase [Chloroflexi bacterium]|nr:coenzyme F420-0:L-glutamate ligase [Chloroflexota bacterium]
MSSNNILTFSAILNFPLIKGGDDLAKIIIESLISQSISLEDGDVIVIAQKIVSKAEGRIVNIQKIKPSREAYNLAKITKKDPKFVQIVLNESNKVIRTGINTLIVEHKRGFICANAGIDHSNVIEEKGGSHNYYLLLPEDPDASASRIRKELESYYKVKMGVVIIDSHGRAWRNGTVGIAIGISGIPGLVDLRGKEDLFGFKLQITTVGAADELAAGASLIMGQASEGTPCVHVRGFPYELRDSKLEELIRPEAMDLFR